MATLASLDADEVEGDETEAEVPIEVTTLAFGTIKQPLKLSFGLRRHRLRAAPALPGPDQRRRTLPGYQDAGAGSDLAADGQAMAKGPSPAREHPSATP